MQEKQKYNCTLNLTLDGGHVVTFMPSMLDPEKNLGTH